MGEKCSWSECKGARQEDAGLQLANPRARYCRYSEPEQPTKILFPYIYEKGDAHAQLGIYGAASKIAMIMAMITQAFRYAYEPFVFGKAKDKDNRQTYASAMKYFVIFTLLAFLVVVGYPDVLRHIIGRDYWDGLKVVPIVMAAEIMMGVYFNLSFVQAHRQDHPGAYFSGIGCAVLIAINVYLRTYLWLHLPVPGLVSLDMEQPCFSPTLWVRRSILSTIR